MSDEPLLNSYEITKPAGDGGKRLAFPETFPADFRALIDAPATGDVAGLADRLSALEHTPMTISSLTVSPSVAEFGATVTSLTFTWARNKVPATQSFDQGIGSISPTATTLTQPVGIASATTYTLTADDGTEYAGHSASRSVTVQFQHRAYWGTSAATSLDSAGILALANQAFGTSRARSFTISGGGQYLYYAYPASWGDAVFTVNGLLNTAWTKTLVNFTNASGNTTQFAVWRSDTIQNGSGIQVSIS